MAPRSILSGILAAAVLLATPATASNAPGDCRNPSFSNDDVIVHDPPLFLVGLWTRPCVGAEVVVYGPEPTGRCEGSSFISHALWVRVLQGGDGCTIVGAWAGVP